MKLTARQRAFIDATKKIRNTLAHSSVSAVSGMNIALKRGSLPTDVRRGKHGITRAGTGTYLSGKPTSQRRYAIYFDALARICDDLCKSAGKPRAIESTV
jgi:hypothetical protein